ncbi:MAG: hypothetical protein LBG99_08265 [Propionibacteriaceae bacterium]|nr:hypothetical protein [Propionibacteriaceae bacterium]
MTHDPEAAWPLTDTTPGYFPSTTPQQMPPSQMMPYTGSPQYTPAKPTPGFSVTPDNSTMRPGHRIAILAIILGAAVPLTAISASYFEFLGMIVSWAGIVFVTAIAFGVGIRRN